LSTVARGAKVDTIRGALVAGFAVVFGVWMFAGYELIRSLAMVDREVAVAIESFAHGRDTISRIRENVLLGSIYVRDALIDSGRNARENYREDLLEFRKEIDTRLSRYEARTPDERAYVEELRTSLDRYWGSIEFVFSPDLPTLLPQSAVLLRTEVVPQREQIMRVLDNLRELQQLSLQAHDAAMTELYNDARTRFIMIVAGALLLGIAVAGFAFWHVGGLEGEIDRQRLSEAQNRQDLERLSARLVDAQEQERRSLARELHDEVGQALTAIKMGVGVALRAGGDARARSSLEEARAIAESTLHNVRDLSQLLHPSMLDDFGLPETLAAYLRSYTKRTGIRATFTHDGIDGRLPGDVEVCLYRIVQEALTNVAHHSGSPSVAVALERRADQVRLTVDDQGRGLGRAARPDIQERRSGVPGDIAHAEPRRGLGLIGMRERAQALAGRFAIENRPEGGVRVSVTLPVPAAALAPDASSAERKVG
jgi:signal transduction histidine kinase